MSEPTRPILFYYGALALAQAASVALFGVPTQPLQHGLSAELGPGYQDAPSWPTVIAWWQSGHFARLYRTVRWDGAFPDKQSRNKLRRFHILECLRWLKAPFGVIPEPFPASPSDSADVRALHLLPFGDGSRPYASVDMPLDTPMLEVPRIAIQHMVLYYFSILARYHAASWQDLLEGRNRMEGFPFRAAAQSIPLAYVRSVVQLLPLPGDSVLSLSKTRPTRPVPTIEEIYEPWPVTTDGVRVYDARSPL